MQLLWGNAKEVVFVAASLGSMQEENNKREQNWEQVQVKVTAALVYFVPVMSWNLSSLLCVGIHSMAQFLSFG